MQEMHAIVEGKVQGVGFRAKSKQLADALHLKGYAKNLANGNVEICAQGDKSQLDLLISELKTYYGSRYIFYIKITFEDVKEKFDAFSVLSV